MGALVSNRFGVFCEPVAIRKFKPKKCLKGRMSWERSERELTLGRSDIL